jgi:hypothetical protein
MPVALASIQKKRTPTVGEANVVLHSMGRSSLVASPEVLREVHFAPSSAVLVVDCRVHPESYISGPCLAGAGRSQPGPGAVGSFGSHWPSLDA